MRRGDYIWIILLGAISAVLVIPATHKVFAEATNLHPYIMGFVKFAIMATMGELLGIRIGEGSWKKTTGMAYKAVIWGIVGMLVVLMFSIFSNGVAGAVKANLLFVGSGALKSILSAFFISAIMNLTFGPMFMAAHRISDTYIDMRAEGKSISLQEVIDKIEWSSFIKFIVGKIVPFFWIPAHTITFLLPAEYRVIVSAYLSVALGIILAYARRRQIQNLGQVTINLRKREV